METTYTTIAAIIAFAMQLATLMMWREARAEADEMRRFSVQRDPKTGRYLSKKGK